MFVKLSHAPNPDIAGGYWQSPKDNPKPMKVTVTNFQEASSACREYIERNGLGSGNWTGGQVFIGRKQMAYVSYNGRVWLPGGTRQSKGGFMTFPYNICDRPLAAAGLISYRYKGQSGYRRQEPRRRDE